ncbi:hypothetical protein NIES2101_42835 [Calothrix sp. HK-06]|nr:hypothetical protein NIES2101_42835 [Calothrix sp. HK-06]
MDTNARKYVCPLEVTIDAISGKWKCLILWWLRRDARRFSELKLLISDITQKVLTQQLRELEEEGLIYRESYPESPPRVEYALTPHGQTFTPIVELMCEWGKQHKPNYQFSYCRLEGIKVLVVSHDATALRTSLEKNSAVVFAATTSEEMFNLLEGVQLDAALIDLTMLSNNDVYLFTSHIKEAEEKSGKVLPKVAIIPCNNPFERGRAFKMGFAVHISKPVETIEIISTLASVTPC